MKFLFQLLLSLADFLLCKFIPGFWNNFQDDRQVTYGTTFRGTGGYQKAGTSSLKRVTGRNFTIRKQETSKQAET